MNSDQENDVNSGKTDLESAMMDSIVSQIRSITEDAAEIALDSVLDEGLLKEIPVVGTFVKLVHLGLGISQRAYLIKICRFLVKLNEVPEEERKAYIVLLESKGEKRKAGETILLLLERLDNVEKASIVGEIYKAHVEGRIDKKITSLLCAMVDRCYLPDLEDLVKVYHGEKIDAEVEERLASIGLMSRAAYMMTEPFVNVSAEINQCGKLLVEIALD